MTGKFRLPDVLRHVDNLARGSLLRYAIRCHFRIYRFIWKQRGIVIAADGPDGDYMEDQNGRASAPTFLPEGITPVAKLFVSLPDALALGPQDRCS